MYFFETPGKTFCLEKNEHDSDVELIPSSHHSLHHHCGGSPYSYTKDGRSRLTWRGSHARIGSVMSIGFIGPEALFSIAASSACKIHCRYDMLRAL